MRPPSSCSEMGRLSRREKGPAANPNAAMLAAARFSR
jgi:hypothetical protein